VFCSSLTFAASANAIAYTGATPVFIDSEVQTWNMCPDLLGEALKESAAQNQLPKAVLVVDLYGQCADYDRISAVCARYDVPILADAAESLGASYMGKPAGSFGSMAALSFNGNKIITCSGGGALLCHREQDADTARFLATQARDPAPHYQHSTLGYNYRLSNLLAAVGRAQLRVLDDRVSARRQNREHYRDGLAEVAGVELAPESPAGQSNAWLTCVLIDADSFGADRETIRQHVNSMDIEVRPVWKPMHQQPLYRDCIMYGGAVADDVFARGLCLPSGSSLTAADRERVIAEFLDSRSV
jgi:pyridoxal phosphate-dependent aminotransferase EpsN